MQLSPLNSRGYIILPPPHAFHWEIFSDLPEKREAREKGKMEKKRKIVKGKAPGKFKMEGNSMKMRFSLSLSLSLSLPPSLSLNQNGNFYQEKAFHARKKIRKSDFIPPEKHSSFTTAASAPVWNCFLLLFMYHSAFKFLNQKRN